MNTQENLSSFTRRRIPQAWPVSVVVETSARLHVGFMDLNFALGRRFGSLGFAIDMPRTRITAQAAPAMLAHGPQADRAIRAAASVRDALGWQGAIHLVVDEAIDAHGGLGSGTQLGLAAGTAVSRLAGVDMDARSIAAIIGRGGRSGIGIGTFETGGIVLDAGKDRDSSAPPPIVWRHAMPRDWRVVLVRDRSQQGVHGQSEIAAFRAAPAMAPETCGEICRLTLMQVIPSVIESDIRGFGAAVTRIQEHVGDYFAPWQGGRRFASPAVAGALDWMLANGAAGIGQSSWGPTGYAIIGHDAAAKHLAEGLRAHLGCSSALDVMVCAPSNSGARIVSTPVLSQARL